MSCDIRHVWLFCAKCKIEYVNVEAWEKGIILSKLYNINPRNGFNDGNCIGAMSRLIDVVFLKPIRSCDS